MQCAWWGNAEILSLSDEAKLLNLYLFTGPHSNGLGCYRLPYGYVSSDTGKGIDTVSKAFSELEEKGISYHCPSTNFLVIPKFLKWNPISNSKVAIAREREFKNIPENFEYIHIVIEDILSYGKHFGDEFLNHIETLLKGYRNRFETRTNPNQPEPNQTNPPSLARKESITELKSISGGSSRS